jgi:Zn finger protein HypA/HybF involved in hydrogenase expression
MTITNDIAENDLSERDEKPLKRRCLVCQSQFDSEWSGERVCKKCKSSSQWRASGS